ncbi:hypothetical protein BX616_004809 [Lobosporangium transversale]|uniref:Uncharacterized protein n=1 Tax=Lobosporangium transversale TaxID=64571 RepID=A0A1Y2H2T2_9FUNG|nr:hypothetical protein BCR41DRAFT_366946 [Lobosporangium transversale]KAF9897889.1 hypothetical protein BX616_004809 [Lobosporangium transversale]ORZ28291.1 hypothetical protein BCR41DRAFT_366946 [Lobosporangium transversale]|eukprot:XP_021885976.1 hypothetical protein BCR41DRAFT_366946 [Lobosporangium transversale]
MKAIRISLGLVSLTSLLSVALMAPVPVQAMPVSLRSYPHHPRADPDPSNSTPSPTPASNNTNSTVTESKTPKNSHPRQHQQPKYDFDILNPEPNDEWISGSLQSLSWVDLNLPPRTTFDITFVPVDPETNPEAITVTRRPTLRYVSALKRFVDVIVPYDLITKEQLVQEQEGDGEKVEEIPEEFIHGVHQGDANDTDLPAIPSSLPTTSAQPFKDIRSQARLYITAYEGRSNKILVRKSVFPIIIRKDHARDLRAVKAPSPASDFPIPLNGGSGGGVAELQQLQQKEEPDLKDVSTESLLEKKDSDITHLEDDVQDQSHGEERSESNEDEVIASTNGDKAGYEGTESISDESSEEPPVSPIINQQQREDENQSVEDDIEKENEINMYTPTGRELGVNTDDTTETEEVKNDHENEHQHQQETKTHSHEEKRDGDEDEEKHDHTHSIDPNFFQNDEDVELWNEHMDDPGYNPPIKVIDAGTINITRWIENKVRFFVGAPYVFAWEFPESGKGLTGVVNVYVEDAFTGKRYDIVAGNMPSDVQFMYLHPSAIMMSATPNKRIYLRARVELDLFKLGNIHRYTGFSKMFWVERGAL